MSNDMTNTYGQCWAFPPQFNPGSAENGVSLVAGIEAIKQSLKVLFITEPAERIMREEYGGGMNDFIFANITDALLARIETRIEDNILRYEPRVKTDSISIRPLSGQASRLLIKIRFRMTGTDIRESVEGQIDLHQGWAATLL